MNYVVFIYFSRGSYGNALLFRLYQDFISRESCDPFLHIVQQYVKRSHVDQTETNRSAILWFSMYIWHVCVKSIGFMFEYYG